MLFTLLLLSSLCWILLLSFNFLYFPILLCLCWHHNWSFLLVVLVTFPFTRWIHVNLDGFDGYICKVLSYTLQTLRVKSNYISLFTKWIIFKRACLLIAFEEQSSRQSLGWWHVASIIMWRYVRPCLTSTLAPKTLFTVIIK